jgi:lipid-binding SYLF domain-containing protein
MSTHIRFVMTVLALTTILIASMGPSPSGADSPPGVDSDVQAALAALYKNTPAAKTLGTTAKGILVFPNIVRAGFIVGAQYGEGELLKDGQIAGYYTIAAASYGLQVGAQGFAYVMFFMTDAGLEYLDRSAGLEIGVGPTIVAIDAGKAKTLTTTTGRDDVYAFIFRQRGLMAGIGLQGSKITRMGR